MAARRGVRANASILASRVAWRRRTASRATRGLCPLDLCEAGDALTRRRAARVPIVVALIAGVASGQPAPLGPSNATVLAAEDSVFHVVASRCQRNGSAVDDRTSSGFGVVAGGKLRLVTALHGVAGCEDIT